MNKNYFFRGLFLGVLTSILFYSSFNLFHPAFAKKSNQMDILYKITAQNYYMTQKVIAYEQFNAALIKDLAEKSKINQVVPQTNRLQQEVFNLDLKIKELNK